MKLRDLLQKLNIETNVCVVWFGDKKPIEYVCGCLEEEIIRKTLRRVLNYKVDSISTDINIDDKPMLSIWLKKGEQINE